MTLSLLKATAKKKKITLNDKTGISPVINFISKIHVKVLLGYFNKKFGQQPGKKHPIYLSSSDLGGIKLIWLKHDT